MVDIQKKLDVKNIHDLFAKGTEGKLKTNNLTDKQFRKYKIWIRIN